MRLNISELCCEMTEDYLTGAGEPSGLTVCQTVSISTDKLVWCSALCKAHFKIDDIATEMLFSFLFQ
jgi:hypothetical protein